MVAPVPWSPVVGRNGGRLSPTEAIVNAVKTLSQFLKVTGAPEGAPAMDTDLTPAVLQARGAGSVDCVMLLRLLLLLLLLLSRLLLLQ